LISFFLVLSTTIDNKKGENINGNSDEITPMDGDQQTSMISQSHIDDDIVEIQGLFKIILSEISNISKFLETSTNDDSYSCTCQCHKPSSPLNNEYLLFEQALKQSRLDQQHERSLNNNRLIQTLKRQHEELINIYQQNKTQKQTSPTTIDREQQTNKLHLQDSQIQTDSTTINNSNKVLPKQEQKSLVIPTMNSNNNGTSSSTRNYSSIFNSVQTSSASASTLQQIIPRLSANAIATTTVTNKTSTVTTKTAIVTNTQATTPIPPPASTAASSHDLVDLTEDEDDNTNRASIPRTAATRQVNDVFFSFLFRYKYFSYQQSTSSAHTPTASPSATTTPTTPVAATATRIRMF
jgi:hypothetical protein